MTKLKNHVNLLTKLLKGIVVLLGLILIISSVSCKSDNKNITSDEEIEGLPPDPGEAGKATIEGIDFDEDGLRDDVQRHIFINFNDEDEREVLVKLSKDIQGMILNSQDKESVMNYADRLGLRVECLFELDPENARRAVIDIQALFANTKERFSAYIKANAQLSGEVFLSHDVDNFYEDCY